MKVCNLLSITLTTVLLPNVAMAQEVSTGDTAWMLTASALVLFMLLPGLSLFYRTISESFCYYSRGESN